MNESLLIKGQIQAVVFNTHGEEVQRTAVANMVVNSGRALVIDRLQSAASAVADYVAIGTSSTAATASQTTLVSEIARAQGTLSQPDAYTDRVVATFGPGVGTGTITEVGRLNASSGGTLMGRGILASSVNKSAGDTLQITYDFTYAAG
jgi:hypothetical protein